MDRPIMRDAALLLLRLVLAIVFIIHGVDIFFGTGLAATTNHFASLGIPQPQLSAVIAGVAQIGGGILLLVGLLTTFAAGALALFMVCASYFVHASQGFFIQNGGLEYSLVLIAALLMIVVFGSGRAAVDELLAELV